VTRPRERSGHSFDVLRSLGFVPVMRRLIRIETAEAELGRAATLLEDADWILFTSADAVRAMDRVRRLQRKSWPAHVRAACVGPATAEAASQAGIPIGLVPQVFDGAALADAIIANHPVASQTFLWPRAEAANRGLADRLREAGASVTDMVAYRTVPNPTGGKRLQRDLSAGGVGAILFFSPSAVDAYVELVGRADPGVVIGVIGRSTGERVRMYDLPVHVQPATHTIRALGEALRDYISGNPQ
jgi:uroporphyrinogen-III synthase/uroporphyrinogen III methyltransferase/synthase